MHSVNIATDTVGLLISTSATTCSGIARFNMVKCSDPSAVLMITAAAVQWGMFENYVQGETTQASGVLLPAAGAQ